MQVRAAMNSSPMSAEEALQQGLLTGLKQRCEATTDLRIDRYPDHKYQSTRQGPPWPKDHPLEIGTTRQASAESDSAVSPKSKPLPQASAKLWSHKEFLERVRSAEQSPVPFWPNHVHVTRMLARTWNRRRYHSLSVADYAKAVQLERESKGEADESEGSVVLTIPINGRLSYKSLTR